MYSLIDLLLRREEDGLYIPQIRRGAEPRRPFTDRYLASLKSTNRRYDVLDPSRKGLLLRVTPNGVKTFYFRYQRNLQIVRLMIGRYPATTLKRAYETHADLVKGLNRGEDIRVNLPPGVRSKGFAHGTPETGLTVGDLAKEFCERYLRRERKNPREAEFVIESEYRSVLADTPRQGHYSPRRRSALGQGCRPQRAGHGEPGRRPPLADVSVRRYSRDARGESLCRPWAARRV